MKRDFGASSSKADNGKKQKTRKFCKAMDRYGAKTAFGVKPGMPGILVFCDRNKEKQSIRECNDMFNEVAKELHPELESDPEIESADDIETSIANEIESLKNNNDKKTYKFSSIKTQVPCVSFLMTKDPIEPVSFVHRLLMRAKETGVTGTRYISRLLPVSNTCYTNLTDIERLAIKLINPVFCVPDPVTNEITPLKFAIAFNSRLCSQVKKEEVISKVASLVKEPHTVDLTKPDVTIVIEIFKSICGISLVRDFYELKKFNIQLVGQLGRELLASKVPQKAEAPIENV